MINMEYTFTIDRNGQQTTVYLANQHLANKWFWERVRAYNLTQFDPDPTGYRYAHNDDLTIRCWIEPTNNC